MDFAFGAMDEIANQAAKARYLWGKPVPLVIRASSGVALYAAQHNNSLEAWFMHTPGLVVVMPSNPADTKGILKSALRGEDPVMFFMHKRLTGARGEVGGPDDLVPIGKAAIARPGSHVTLISSGIVVQKALKAAEALAADGIDAEVIDLRTIFPLDMDLIAESVRKTGRAIVVTEEPPYASVASEIAASIQEDVFEYLDAPVARLTAAHAPIPHAPQLMEALLPQVETVVEAVQALDRALAGKRRRRPDRHPELRRTEMQTTPSLQESYERDGFVVGARCATAEAVEEAVAHMDAVIAGDYETGVAPHWRRWNPGDDEARLRKIDQPQLCDRTVARFIDNEAIGRAAAELTGAARVQVWGVQLLYKPSGGGSSGNVGWHQDLQYWLRWWTPDSEIFTCWLALSDVTEEAGAMRFVSRLAHLGRADDRRLLPAGDRSAARSDRGARRLGVGGGSCCAGTGLRELPPQSDVPRERAEHIGGPRRSFAIHLRTENSELADLSGLPADQAAYMSYLDDPAICPSCTAHERSNPAPGRESERLEPGHAQTRAGQRTRRRLERR